MRIAQRSAFAKRLATKPYDGAIAPLSVVKPADRHHEVDWWTCDSQYEGAESLRQLVALALYLEVAKHSKIALPPQCFPASFDFDDEQMRPDKGVIRVHRASADRATDDGREACFRCDAGRRGLPCSPVR